MVSLLLVVLLVPAGVLLAARALDSISAGGAPNPALQLAAFAPWGVPLWAAGTALAAGSGSWGVAAVAAVALIVQLCWAIPSGRASQPARRDAVPDLAYGARADGARADGARADGARADGARADGARADGARADGAGGSAELTLVSVNALFGRADPDVITGLVAHHGADVLVVQELTLGLARTLDDALRAAGLRQAALHPAPGGAGTGIWSRWPIRPVRLLPTRDCAMPQVLIEPPHAAAVLVTGVHTVAPHPARVDDWRADLAMLARAVRTSSGPQIFAGDFNASRDHAAFREILAAGAVDAADVAGIGPGFTWPADRAFPPLTRLDHVLVSDAVVVRGTSVETVPGTDHRAVVARLGLPVRQLPVPDQSRGRTRSTVHH